MAPKTDPTPPAAPPDAVLITRREAVQRVTALLGGIALVGGSALLTACRDEGAAGDAASAASFSAEDVAFLDEVADTILPETSTPGAKAAGTGAFMALMVTDTYEEEDQRIFREGMRRLDEACREMHDVSFMQATPAQRLALLERLDREQWEYTRARQEARDRRDRAAAPTDDDAADRDSTATDEGDQGDAYVPGQRQEGSTESDANPAAAITADAPAHYFRMMKELALLGYFTSEIGYTQAMRYQETPGRFDPCVPYTEGETIWAPHA